MDGARFEGGTARRKLLLRINTGKKEAVDYYRRPFQWYSVHNDKLWNPHEIRKTDSNKGYYTDILEFSSEIAGVAIRASIISSLIF